ncbi:MAG: hypothetical protein RLZZ312_396 [Bacteroidota bacterium]
MKHLKIILLLLFVQTYAQQGGMWIPSMLSAMNETEMKNLGMKISKKDIYDTNKSSLKDAVLQFDGGCTAEMISAKGLLLTNHHCGFDAIQNLSSVKNDYLTDGFWAYNIADELPAKDVDVMFIVSINDVTVEILAGTTANEDEVGRQRKIQENITKLTASFKKEAWQENKIRTFYDGNQFILFVTETFLDVRLVGTPPSSIGKFGSDTDNWVWPRHTGDFSMFRIYADANNRPAKYSKDNKPYIPKHFLPISLDGVQENDFTLVMGFPGRTQEYLPSFAVAQIQDELNPVKIELRENALKIMDGFMRKDNAIKIQYASKYASIANYWKKWIGETQGLKKSNAIQKKQNQEIEFQKLVEKANKKDVYGNLLSEFKTNYSEIKNAAIARDFYSEIALRHTELLVLANKLLQLEQVFLSKGEQAFSDRKTNFINAQADFYKNYNVNVDEKIFEKLIDLYANKSPKQFLPKNLQSADVTAETRHIYKNSKLLSYDGLKAMLNGDAITILSRLNADAGFAFAKQLSENFQKNVAPKFEEINQKNVALQRTYMRAQLELGGNKRIFPDANSTLRVTYGKVKGFEPRDGVSYDYATYLDGVIEKFVPGDYEFDVPKKLLDLYSSKDFGQYADKNGKVPVCFIGTNHTTGGNSGSPAIDAKGNLIGLNFDRVWEGTMSDINYDSEICRNIMVDARYILFIVDKFAGAKNIISELKLVHSKTKKQEKKL